MKNKITTSPQILLLLSFIGILIGHIGLFFNHYIILVGYDTFTKLVIRFIIIIPIMFLCLNGKRTVQILMGIFNLFQLLMLFPSMIIIFNTREVEGLKVINKFMGSIILFITILSLLSAFILFFKGNEVNMNIDLKKILKGKKNLQIALFFSALLLPSILLVTTRTKWEIRDFNHYQINLPKNWILTENSTSYYFNEKNNKSSFILVTNYELDFSKENIDSFKESMFVKFENHFKKTFEDYKEISRTDNEMKFKVESAQEGGLDLVLKAVYLDTGLMFITSAIYTGENSSYKEIHKKVFDSITFK